MTYVGVHKTWTVRISRDDSRDGHSVWTGCPYESGTPIYLEVLELPVVALRIGDSKGRLKSADPGPGPLGRPGAKNWANGPLSHGPWPGHATRLRVGCALHVIPAWDHVLAPMVTGLEHPEPTHGSLEGVDVRGLEFLEAWASIAPAAVFPERIRSFPWVRHSTGFWSQPEGTFAPASAPGHHFRVPCRGADRVALQVEYVQPAVTPGGAVCYGILTPPLEKIPTTTKDAPEIYVRFGAVLAPEQKVR